MNTCEWLISFLQNILASLVGILIALWLDSLKRPHLSFSIGSRHSIESGDTLGRPPMTWIRLLVHNRNVPSWLSWVYHGEPALTCRATISYYYEDGKEMPEKTIEGRWTDSPEPEVHTFTVKDKGQVGMLVGAENSFDIQPGEDTHLDIAIRKKDDDSCFCWNNKSYLIGWFPSKYYIGSKGRFLVKVRIKTGGHDYIDVFWMINDEGYEGFRLEPVDKAMKKTLCKL